LHFGAILVVTRGQGFGFDPRYGLGYFAALVAAVSSASDSVLSRRFAAVSSDAITGFCLGTALLAGLCHFALEPTVWPDNPWHVGGGNRASVWACRLASFRGISG